MAVLKLTWKRRRGPRDEQGSIGVVSKLRRGDYCFAFRPLGQTEQQRAVAALGKTVVLGSTTPRGRLRVGADRFAHVALPRIAALFAATYPEVQLKIVANDRKIDPVEDGYDLVIRIDPAADKRLVGRRFLNDERLIVAPPEQQCYQNFWWPTILPKARLRTGARLSGHLSKSRRCPPPNRGQGPSIPWRDRKGIPG